MKKFLMLTLVLVALGTITTFGLAQGPRESKTDSAIQVQSRRPTLACCDCLGKVTTLDLSTGRASPKDPIWSVNGTFAYTTPKVSSWIALPTANWIQPDASPLPSNNILGNTDYSYTVSFYIPECAIPNSVRLSGNFAADNSAIAKLDKIPILNASCPGPVCFNTSQAPVSLNGAPPIGPGPHTLEIIVHNDSIYSGLIVNAKLTRQCVRGNVGSTGNQTMEPNN
jgi:hypothetical protein